MVKIKIRLTMFFAAKGRESLYSENKILELTVAEIINCLLQNSGLNQRK